MDSEPPRRPGLFWAGILVAGIIAPVTAPVGGGPMPLIVMGIGAYMIYLSGKPPK